MATTYSATIAESSAPLSRKEKVSMKDTSNCLRLDIELDKPEAEFGINITPDLWAVVQIHNDKSDNPDYNNYIVRDKETGIKYVTGSESFWNAFKEIWDEMGGIDTDEEWGVNVYKMASKNYSGKSFITCSII